MTGIVTKQNALDKALVGGSSTGGSNIGNGGNGLIDNLHVYHNATFDGATRFENLDGSSVTFKSTPIFDNDLIAIVDGEPTSIGNVMDDILALSNSNTKVAEAVTAIDDKHYEVENALIDKLTEVSDTLDQHLQTHPDINNNDEPSALAEYEPSTLSLITKSPTITTRDIDDIVEEPPVEEPEIPEVTVDDVNTAMDTLITNLNESLIHFETNDATLHQITDDHEDKLNTLDTGMSLATGLLNQLRSEFDILDDDVSSISNTMACKVDLDETNEKLTQLRSEFDVLDGDFSTLSASVAHTADLDAVNEKLVSLNTAVDARYTKLEIDDMLKNINGEVVIDLSDRYTKKEVDDKLTPINNKFDDYVTITAHTSDITSLTTSLNDRYTKTEVDDELAKYALKGDVPEGVTNEIDIAGSISKVLSTYDNYKVYDKLEDGLNYISHITIQTNEIWMSMIGTEYPKVMYLYLMLDLGEIVEFEIDMMKKVYTFRCAQHGLNIDIESGIYDGELAFCRDDVELPLEGGCDDSYETVVKYNAKKFILIEQSTDSPITDSTCAVVKHLMNENTKKFDDYYNKKDLSLSTLSSVMSYDDYTTDDQMVNGCKYLNFISIVDGEAFLSFKGTTYQKARYLYLVMMMYPDVNVIEEVIFEYDMKRDTGTFSWVKQSITTPLKSMMIDGAYCLCGSFDAQVPTYMDDDIETYKTDIKRFVLIEDTGNDNEFGDVLSGVMKSIINNDVTTKALLSRTIENTFFECIKHDRTTVNYVDEANKYIDNITFVQGLLDLSFKQR